MGRPELELQILAKLESIERRLAALEERAAGVPKQSPQSVAGPSSTKKIVADLAMALSGKIPKRNLASAIARKAHLSDRQVRRLLQSSE